MSAAQAGILLLSLLWPFFFIKSDCPPLRGLPHLLVLAIVTEIPFSLLQLLAYSHPINTVPSRWSLMNKTHYTHPPLDIYRLNQSKK